MCSNLLEKISKEERESESGGMEGLVAKMEEGKEEKMTGLRLVVWVVVK